MRVSRALLCACCCILIAAAQPLPASVAKKENGAAGACQRSRFRRGERLSAGREYARSSGVNRNRFDLCSPHQFGVNDRLTVRGGSSMGVLPSVRRLWPWLLLNFVVILWSSDECLIKHMLDTQKARSPAFLNASRFAVAALVFLPWRPAAPWQPGMRELWVSGAELGLWVFLGFATQAIGLQYTTVSRSAFLLYLNVVLVPVLGSVLFGRSVRRTTWMNAALALFGTVLLGYDGGQPNIGDVWCLSSALASALFILRLEAAAQRHDAAKLNCASMLVVAALCLLWLVTTEGVQSIRPTLLEVGSALYLGSVPTALCSFLQTVGQREIEAESAAIIYAMDPVYTAVLGTFILGERLGLQGLLGGSLLLLASLMNLRGSPKSP